MARTPQQFPRTLWLGFSFVFGLLGLAYLISLAETGRVSQHPVLGRIADFTLTNQSGQVTTLADLSNHVWVADIIFTPTMYYEVLKAIPLSLSTLFGIVWRPILAGGAMAVVIGMHPFAHIDLLAVRLVLEVCTGAVCFVAVLVLLWIAAGQPEGGEEIIVSRFKMAFFFKPPSVRG